MGCSPWGREESDRTERLHFHFSPSCIGEGNGNPLQCSCLENPRDGRAWWAAVYGVTQSRTWLTRLSSSSSIYIRTYVCVCVYICMYIYYFTDFTFSLSLSFSLTISSHTSSWNNLSLSFSFQFLLFHSISINLCLFLCLAATGLFLCLFYLKCIHFFSCDGREFDRFTLPTFYENLIYYVIM